MNILKNKVLWWLLAVIALVYAYVEADSRGDFYIFMSASKGLGLHQNIYRTNYSEFYNYFYSVLFAVFLKLFQPFPFLWVKFFWLLFNIALYIHLFSLLARAQLLTLLSERQKRLFLVLVFLFSFRFLHENIHASQITILILWCCIYGLLLIHRGQGISGSAILAAGINIKLLPVVFIPYLLFRGYYKEFMLTTVFCVAALFVPSIIIGHEYNMLLLQSWLSLINPLQQRHVLDVDERSFHSLSTLLSTLLVKDVPDTYAMALKRNIADISLPALAKVLLTVRLTLAAATLYFLRWKPFVKAKGAFDKLTEISYILLLIPLIFPHQQHYAFLFAVPAFALVLFYLLSGYNTIPVLQRRTVTCALCLIYLAASLKILLGEFNHYYEHFKILTYAALGLILLLIWVSWRHKKNPSEVTQDEHVPAVGLKF